jgi:hypothetical protein
MRAPDSLSCFHVVVAANLAFTDAGQTSGLLVLSNLSK